MVVAQGELSTLQVRPSWAMLLRGYRDKDVAIEAYDYNATEKMKTIFKMTFGNTLNMED